MYPTHQSLSNVQHRIVFDANTRNKSPVSGEVEEDDEEEKESFQQIQHFL